MNFMAARWTRRSCSTCGNEYSITSSIYMEDCRSCVARKRGDLPKECEICGKEFMPVNRRQKHCSTGYRSCQQESQYRKTEAKTGRKIIRLWELPPRDCQHCGKRFQPSGLNSKSCSDFYCRVVGNQRRTNRKRAAANALAKLTRLTSELERRLSNDTGITGSGDT